MNKLVIALLAGVTAGILIAPDKGSVTRKKLLDGFNDLADSLEGLKEKFASSDPQTVNDQLSAAPKMSRTI